MPEGHRRARPAVLARDARAGHPRRPARARSPRTATACARWSSTSTASPTRTIVGLNIPNGIPLVYELDDDAEADPRYYLGDAEAARKAAEAVAKQAQQKG